MNLAWELELEQMIKNDPRLQRVLDEQKAWMKKVRPDQYARWFENE